MKNVKSATHASRALAVLALIAVPGCRSTSADPSEPELLACVCGDPHGNLLGCTHPLCVESEGNPENPDCVCGGLSVEAASPGTPVSLGAGGTNRALGELQILSLESGGRVRGTLVFDDGLSIRIRFADGNTKNYTYDELAPKSVCRLMKAKASYDDGPGQIEVGNYARDVGYYAHARRHYEAAVKADPALEDRVERELAKLRALASQQELVQAQAAYRDGRTVEAEDHLANLLREFPDEEAADSATAMLGEIRAREAGTTRTKSGSVRPRIVTSSTLKAERSTPDCCTVVSDTMSSAPYSLVCVSSRLAVLTESPMAVTETVSPSRAAPSACYSSVLSSRSRFEPWGKS